MRIELSKNAFPIFHDVRINYTLLFHRQNIFLFIFLVINLLYYQIPKLALIAGTLASASATALS